MEAKLTKPEDREHFLAQAKCLKAEKLASKLEVLAGDGRVGPLYEAAILLREYAEYLSKL